jgi:molybdopterin converting factor small subunit
MTGAATVTVRIPGVLRSCCGGLKEFPLSVSSVRGALEAIERLHPTLHRRICDETGAVRRHVNVFVNMDHVRDHSGLDTALAPGDVVWFLPAVSGG